MVLELVYRNTNTKIPLQKIKKLGMNNEKAICPSSFISLILKAGFGAFTISEVSPLPPAF